MTRNYEFSLFAQGADLAVASTVEQLERAGYTHPAAAASAGIQALVFVRAAHRLADAVEAVASEVEQIEGVSIAREVRTELAAAFDPLTLDAMSLRAEAVANGTINPAPMQLQRRANRSPHHSSTISMA